MTKETCSVKNLYEGAYEAEYMRAQYCRLNCSHSCQLTFEENAAPYHLTYVRTSGKEIFAIENIGVEIIAQHTIKDKEYSLRIKGSLPQIESVLAMEGVTKMLPKEEIISRNVAKNYKRKR